jgi:hypothetical protein
MNTATPADPGCSLELEPSDGDASRAHRGYHGRLQLAAALGEAVADRDHERHGEHAQRQHHHECLAVKSRDRMAVGAAERHHEEHRPAERPQRLSLPMQTLQSTRPNLRYPLAVRR